MELREAKEFLSVNGILIDRCTATGKYFWMECVDMTFANENSGFDTVEDAFDDALTYLKSN